MSSCLSFVIYKIWKTVVPCYKVMCIALTVLSKVFGISEHSLCIRFEMSSVLVLKSTSLCYKHGKNCMHQGFYENWFLSTYQSSVITQTFATHSYL